MDWTERIVIDSRVLVGKPVVKGTRLAVEFVLELMSRGWSEEQITAQYPGITREDILACLRYATESLKAERVFPV